MCHAAAVTELETGHFHVGLTQMLGASFDSAAKDQEVRKNTTAGCHKKFSLSQKYCIPVFAYGPF